MKQLEYKIYNTSQTYFKSETNSKMRFSSYLKYVG